MLALLSSDIYILSDEKIAIVYPVSHIQRHHFGFGPCWWVLRSFYIKNRVIWEAKWRPGGKGAYTRGDFRRHVMLTH